MTGARERALGVGLLAAVRTRALAEMPKRTLHVFRDVDVHKGIVHRKSNRTAENLGDRRKIKDVDEFGVVCVEIKTC